MSKGIIISVIAGILSGYFFLPEAFIQSTETLLVIGLCIMLFFVGVDLGREGTVVQNVKDAGLRLLVFPVMIILGTGLGCLVGSLFMDISVIDSIMVGSGFGWYTLAPVVIAPYSTEISAISFMHNVFRELIGIILIPFIARYIGHIECVALPGAAAMDVCLPIVEKATSPGNVVFSFVSGVVLSIFVPAIVPVIVSIAQSM